MMKTLLSRNKKKYEVLRKIVAFNENRNASIKRISTPS